MFLSKCYKIYSRMKDKIARMSNSSFSFDKIRTQ
jgi:hypothetical protein